MTYPKKKASIFAQIRHNHAQGSPYGPPGAPQYYGPPVPPDLPTLMLGHKMWQHLSHFGGPGLDTYGVPYQYHTPPLPPLHGYSDFPDFHGEVINIESDMARGTNLGEAELMTKKNKVVDIKVVNDPKNMEDGANEGRSGGAEKRATPDLFSFFAKKKK